MRRIRWSLTLTFTIAGGALAACGGARSKPPTTSPRVQVTQATTPRATSCIRADASQPGPERVAKNGIGSTVVLAKWAGKNVAFVSDSDDRAVHAVDVDSKKHLSTTKLDGRPGQLVMLKDGRLVVTLRDRAKLAVLDPARADAPLETRCSVDTPADPVGLALTPGEDVLVAAAWDHALAAYRGDELKHAYTVDVEREPQAIVVSAEGKTAFVAHSVGGKASIVDLETKQVRRVMLEGLQHHHLNELRKKATQQLDGQNSVRVDGIATAGHEKLYQLASAEIDRLRTTGMFAMRTSCQSFALARAENPGGRIFAPQVLVDPGNLEQRAQGYGNTMMRTEVPSVAVIDEKTGLPLMSSLAIGNDTSIFSRFGQAPEPERCVLPRAAAVDDTSQSLLVACYGIDTVIAYDAASADPAHAEKRRWRVPAGPSGIAVDRLGRRAVVWSQFDRNVAVIPLGEKLEQEEGKDDETVARIEIEADPERQLSVAIALGRSLFHASGDQRIARDGRACASCHPDGRDDGLVWATPNGPRRTKMLAGMLKGTAPFSWDGDNAKLTDHLQDTFKRLSGEGGLRSLELRALVAYLESLEAPTRAGISDKVKIARGESSFRSAAAGCATCHDGHALTDSKLHDVQSQHKGDRTKEFDTPSLRFISGRAPYFHDGRYRTLRELLVGTSGKMGHTAQLSPQQLDDLESYLKSL
jgi:DNA-binding beta-propeller fold protein YncE/mono/diheme cytochrome c family protein